MMKQSHSTLFSADERSRHKDIENNLVAQARRGDLNPLLTFWREKRVLLLRRAYERIQLAGV